MEVWRDSEGSRETAELWRPARPVVELFRGSSSLKDTPATGTEAADRLAAGVKLLEANPFNGQLTIYPTATRSWSDDFLGPKYAKITSIIIPADVEPGWDVADGLEELPSGFTKDYEYGVGLAQECEVIIDLIEESTN